MVNSKIGAVFKSVTPCQVVKLPPAQFPGFVNAAKKPAESRDGKQAEVLPEPKKSGVLAENAELVRSKANPSQLMMKLVKREPMGANGSYSKLPDVGVNPK